ncbi:MAG: tetratricopeptide repeat protein [Nitrospirae bacterium]|nr:tetratricopeptide repeat protein [Nitrospirota bacterium]MBI3352595.1 tetratricopeptide repeat protein [Nitrospirota bacterium]
MPYRKRIQIKKELEPIAIDSLTEKIWGAFLKKKASLLILSGGLVLFAIAFYTYTYISAQTEKKAEDMEFAAFSEYSKKNRMTGPEQEKQTKSAIDLYQKILSIYPKTKSAAIAAFYVGNSYVDLKDYDRGIEFYNKALTFPLDEMMRGVVNLRLGYAYLNKNDKEQALKIFGLVEKTKLARDQDAASYEIGQIYESQGKKNEALAQYESLVKAYPSSPIAAEASARITALKGPPAAQNNNPSSSLSVAAASTTGVSASKK